MARLILFIAFLAFISTIHSNDDHTSLFEHECEVTGVSIAFDSGFIYVTWLPVDLTICPDAKQYHLSYQVEDGELVGPLGTLTPDTTLVRIEIGELFCERVLFEISTLNGDNDILATIFDIPFKRYIPTPSGIKVVEVEDDGKLRVDWDLLWDKTKTDCVVSYTVNYKTSTDTTQNNYYEIDANDLNFCTTHTIEITASSNGFVSLPNTYNFRKNVPSVEIVDSSDQSSVIFKPLQDTLNTDCGEISYKIIQKDLKCLISLYTVIATPTDVEYESLGYPIEIQKKPGAVNNITVETTETKIYLNWEPPAFLDNCNVKYEIHYDESSISTHVTNTNFPATLAACVEKPIEITGIIESVKGETSKILAYGKIEKVENLKCSLSGNDVKCSWEEPKNSENCDTINYRVNYFNGNDIQSEIVVDLSIVLKGIDCQVGWISLETFQIVDGKNIYGNSIETTIEGCVRKTKLNPSINRYHS